MQSVKLDEHTILSQISQKISPYLAGPWFMLALAAMVLATYSLDLATPLGVPVWLLYFIPLGLSFWSKPHYAIPTVCGVTLLFLAAGYIFSPPGIQTFTALLMRTAFSVLVIGVAIVLLIIRRRNIRAGILHRS
jgi:hypothetical protein